MKTSFKRYFKVWLLTASNALQETFINRWSNVLFFLGKSIRFIVMISFLILLKNNIRMVGDYTTDQILVFYITYQVIDTSLQILYRGAYEFGGMVRNGEVDKYLTRPINTLFSVLTGTPDINDVVFLIPSSLFSLYLLSTLHISLSLTSILVYGAVLFNSFLIGTALHIFILSFTLISTLDDNVVWIYRDISRLSQFPVTIYSELFRLFLFFIVPVGFMVTVPAQVLLSVPPTYSLLLTFGVGISFFWLSLKTWNWSLKKYSSASS